MASSRGNVPCPKWWAREGAVASLALHPRADKYRLLDHPHPYGVRGDDLKSRLPVTLRSVDNDGTLSGQPRLVAAARQCIFAAMKTGSCMQ